MPTLIFTSAQDPTPRARLGENRPEERRSVILDRLRASSRAADIIAVEPNATALEKAKDLQCVTANKLSFLGSVHEAYRTDPSPDHSFASSETACGTGVVPYFFTRLAATERDPWPRRLAWHATDGLTPIFEDLPEVLAADAAVCERAAIFFDVESGKRGEEPPAFLYVLPTHPGHHATAEHYGGYCFLNLAVFIDALLRERGFSPFIIDVDYHAGDGTASFLGASGRFVSLHVRASLAALRKLHTMPHIPMRAAHGHTRRGRDAGLGSFLTGAVRACARDSTLCAGARRLPLPPSGGGDCTHVGRGRASRCDMARVRAAAASCSAPSARGERQHYHLPRL